MIGPSLRILGGQAVQAAALFRCLREEGAIPVSFLAVNPQLPGWLGRLQQIRYVRTIVTSMAYIAALLARVPGCDVLHVFSASYWSFVLAPTPAIVAGRLF
ncbi:MAG TPA: hypothetical protein VFL57_11880, partial [Bryobacteraceae bacterium]|nr:hypothetical protein [Bryobacteraceae bacterium]